MSFSLLKHMGIAFASERHQGGWLDAAMRFAGAGRALYLREQHRELFSLQLFARYVGGREADDALFHISHRHYLSTRLTAAQRVGCALTHFRSESDFHDDAYQDAVYASQGLILWCASPEAMPYTIRLRAAEHRREGIVGVQFVAGDQILTEMCFSWVDGAIFGQSFGVVPFITRNQSVRHDQPALQRFRRDFPQNSPPYFCLAAIHGIAGAHGLNRVAAIRSECQIAFKDQHADGFRNSYCDFWRSFGADELDAQAYVMPVPLAVPPLSEVRSKHRKRALARRRHWSEIMASAERVVAQHRRRSPVERPAPVTMAATALFAHLPVLASIASAL